MIMLLLPGSTYLLIMQVFFTHSILIKLHSDRFTTVNYNLCFYHVSESKCGDDDDEFKTTTMTTALLMMMMSTHVRSFHHQ